MIHSSKSLTASHWYRSVSDNERLDYTNGRVMYSREKSRRPHCRWSNSLVTEQLLSSWKLQRCTNWSNKPFHAKMFGERDAMCTSNEWNRGLSWLHPLFLGPFCEIKSLKDNNKQIATVFGINIIFLIIIVQVLIEVIYPDSWNQSLLNKSDELAWHGYDLVFQWLSPNFTSYLFHSLTIFLISNECCQIFVIGMKCWEAHGCREGKMAARWLQFRGE